MWRLARRRPRSRGSSPSRAESIPSPDRRAEHAPAKKPDQDIDQLSVNVPDDDLLAGNALFVQLRKKVGEAPRFCAYISFKNGHPFIRMVIDHPGMVAGKHLRCFNKRTKLSINLGCGPAKML